jgi:hypothetical protein
MEGASEVIFKLKPVSFRYKPAIEPTRPLGFGLIAEDVEKISPDLVTRDSDGEANSVRYDAINAMLLNEFLKEHTRVQQLQATAAQQRKHFEAIAVQLMSQLKEQSAEIQKISAQLDCRTPTTNTLTKTD